MGIRRYKPTTPGRRGATVSDFADLTPGAKPEKSCCVPSRRRAAATTRAGSPPGIAAAVTSSMYRLIDFRRNKDGVPAKVHSIAYDPNRSARIALLHYVDGEKRYILAPHGLKAGDQVLSGPDAPPSVGNCLPLKSIPLGMAIHNIELQPGRGGVLVPLGRHQRHVGRPRSRLGPDQPAQRRNSPRAGCLPGHDRHDRQSRSRCDRDRQGRAAIAGRAFGPTCAARP